MAWPVCGSFEKIFFYTLRTEWNSICGTSDIMLWPVKLSWFPSFL
jgi:hypothetical protein